MDRVDEVVIVVPTIREESIKAFLAAWRWPCEVIVIEDNPERTFDLAGVQHYAWTDIERDLGDDSWIIPRRTDCIRSYGYWKAWQTGKPYIITLDDDCLPNKDGHGPRSFIDQHLNNLKPKPINRWRTTLVGDYPRGYPYETAIAQTPVAVSHGLWRGVLDYDSLTQLRYGRSGVPWGIEPREDLIPFGRYFPMCGMNLAWRREYTPLMYFLLMGQDAQGRAYPFDRFGDIWCGIIAKKILDHLGVAVWSGAPLVQHERASNVWANFDKEHAGIKENETFWQRVDRIKLLGTTPRDCYQELSVAMPDGAYGDKLGTAMLIWSDLYE